MIDHPFVRRLAAVLALFLACAAAPAQDAGPPAQDAGPPAQAEEPAAAEEEPLEIAPLTVTGSNLKSGDPTVRVYSFTAEDIAVRGVSSLEDFLRTLPWTFPSATTQTNTYEIPGDDREVLVTGVNELGTSSVNLRSLGSANTLVLLNGRRVAGVAGNDANFVNLLNVPLSAIERVDIQLDGASAVYGADAIGGVVNFVTKRNYSGLSATVRNEFSSTDAGRTGAKLQGGHAWGSGNLTATVSREASEPITNSKTGWVSSDYRSQYGPEYDLRFPVASAQPGIVCDFAGDSFLARILPFELYAAQQYFLPGCAPGAPRLQLPGGRSGAGAAPADFSPDIAPSDYIRPQNGEDSTNLSFHVNVDQYLTDDFRVFAEVLYSRHESRQEYDTPMANYLIPASNAYNPFGKNVVVSYRPLKELEDGLLPQAYAEAENRQRNLSAGFVWNLAGDHQLEFNATRSESEDAVWQITADYIRRSHSALGAELDPATERFFAVLASPDPTEAFNPFGDGSAQGAGIADLLGSVPTRLMGFTETTGYKPVLRGSLFNVWGGAVEYAAGAELRKDVIHRSQPRVVNGKREVRGVREAQIGVARPTQELTAWFAELAFPLISGENARPAARELTLSVQARRDTYKAEGAAGGVTTAARASTRVYVPGRGWTDWNAAVAQAGAPNLTRTRKSDTSPRVALRYAPAETFVTRAAWSQSFRPPLFTDLFQTEDLAPFPFPWSDPYHPDGSRAPVLLPVTLVAYNPDIRSEISDNYSVGFEWTPGKLAGFRWTLDWSRIDFRNKIENSFLLLLSHPEILFGLPEVVQRDAGGYAMAVTAAPINLSQKISEIVDSQWEYAFGNRFGQFTARLNYTRTLNDYFQIAEGTERVSLKGTQAGSNDYKLTGALTWQTGRFAADVFVYYTPGYENNRVGQCQEAVGRCIAIGDARPPLEVDALTTVDITATWRFDNGLRVRGGGRNVFEADSPTIWGAGGASGALPYDPTRWDARGRVLFLELNWEL